MSAESNLPFRPTGQDDLAPPGATAKLRANLDALDVLRRCRAEARPAEVDEQVVLARWSGWGSIPQVFDDADDRFAGERIEILPRASVNVPRVPQDGVTLR